MVEEVAELLADRAQSKGQELVCDIQPSLPSRLRGDPGRLRQVLSNLADNAVKFTDGGEVLIRVRASEKSETTAQLHFEVRDTGIGISQEACNRLFQAFSQADGSTTRKYGGTGLGLAISKQLTEMMDGKIGVESQPGKGSTFWFNLPLEKQPDAAQPSLLAPDGLKALHVLIVDNHPETLGSLRRQLAFWGIRSEGATNAPKAAQMVRSFQMLDDPFNIVLLDNALPDMGAAILAKGISHDAAVHKPRVILMTPIASRHHDEETLKADIDATLAKPVRQARLLQALAGEVDTPAPRLTLSRARTLAKIASTPAPCRILVAEDNIVNQKVVVYMLQKLGLRADVAANGKEAVMALERIPYDLVLMDCQMPEMDGFEATAEIRRREQVAPTRLPIIAMTANAMPGDREKCLLGGMDDYLAKPVKTEDLAALLQHWLPGQAAAETSETTLSSDAETKPTAEAPPVDLSRLQGIYKHDDRAVGELLEIYLSTTQTLIEQLGAAIAQRNGKLGARLAHEIKGASAYIAAQEMLRLARSIEAAIKKSEWEEVERHFDELEPIFIRTWGFINGLDLSTDTATQ